MSKEFNPEEYIFKTDLNVDNWGKSKISNITWAPVVDKDAISKRHVAAIKQRMNELMEEISDEELEILYRIAEKIEHVNKVIELFKEL